MSVLSRQSPKATQDKVQAIYDRLREDGCARNTVDCALFECADSEIPTGNWCDYCIAWWLVCELKARTND